jgi:hypothetical protein
MRTAETDYTLPANLPGDPVVNLAVTWEIEFDADRKGVPERSIWIKATPVSVQVTIGGEPFGETKVRAKPSDGLRDWLRARATDLTFESIGYTEEEAKREYSEEEEDREEESNQIGRPL